LAALEIHLRLQPALARLGDALAAKSAAFADLVKIGRTHLQDATPITLGQEFSGWAAQVALARARIEATLPGLLALAQGATAVGTGLNADPRFAEAFARRVAALAGLSFVSAANKFEAIAAHDALVFTHGALTSLAAALYKIACDIRLLGSGPRSGLAELRLPENEPGSSIMPGKVNPTQVEAMTMVCARVFGNHATIAFAGASGQLELNVYKPVIIYALLQSIDLLAGAMASLDERCVRGIAVNEKRIREDLGRSLMTVTALNPRIGYDAAARIAKLAHEKDLSLRQAAVELAILSAEEFDELVKPEEMV
jgi:fumarate hydratase class II